MARDSYHHIFVSPQPGKPLIFTLHGTGGDEHQFSGLVQELLPGAGLVSPRGDVSEHGAARFFRRTGEGVYDMDDLAARTQKMVGFVTAHRELHPETTVIGLGYSNGANILASVLFEAPRLFERAVLMHPLIPWTPPPQPDLAGLELLVTAGKRDPICPLPMTEALAQWFEAQGAQVNLELHSGGHEVARAELSAIAGFLAAGEHQEG